MRALRGKTISMEKPNEIIRLSEDRKHPHMDFEEGRREKQMSAGVRMKNVAQASGHRERDRGSLFAEFYAGQAANSNKRGV